MIFLCVYQASMGSYFFPYVAQIAVDTANSVASMVLWTGILVMAAFSNTFFDKLGNAGTFYMFFGINIVGTIYVALLMKETKGKTREEQIGLYRYKGNSRRSTASINEMKPLVDESTD